MCGERLDWVLEVSLQSVVEVCAPLQQRCLGFGAVAVALHRQPLWGADSFTAAVASWLDVGVVVAAALAPAAEEARM